MMTNIRNIGILAHVDAGKTTTTEHLLFQSGRLKTLGRVDDGTAHTDSMPIEKSRGISVRSAVTRFEWRQHVINLIDTPGHVDFSGEVERALGVLDGAILIVSAVDGVQAHTETLWHTLYAMNIPTVIYVNKVDRVGVDLDKVIRDMRDVLHPAIIPVQLVDHTGPEFSTVSNIFKSSTPVDLVASFLENCQTVLAEHDEELLKAFVDDKQISIKTLQKKLIEQSSVGRAYPTIFGASLKGIGIEELLDAVVTYLPQVRGGDQDALSAVVFKIEQDPAHGRMAYVRIFSGTLQNRDLVPNVTQGIEEKVSQIREIDVRTNRPTGLLTAGDVGVVYGLHDVRVGDILGSSKHIRDTLPISVPLLTVQVIPKDALHINRLVEAVQQLDLEDPTLSVEWLPMQKELHIKVIGKIQLEVLAQLLLDRYGISVEFGPPTVIYKETPIQSAEGFVAYTMPKPCWAVLRFLIEPGPRGSGITYDAKVRTEDLLQRYQNEVERRVPEALEHGLSGWQVTDLKITLIEGQHHVWHTHPLDFVVATPMGIMDGLKNAGTRLLEPIVQFRLSVPEEFGGRILSDLSQMRAEFDNPVNLSGRLTIEGTAPVATTMEYPLDLAILTGGRAVFSSKFFAYSDAPPDVRATRVRRGVDPLDTSQYILWARNALSV